MGKQMLGGQAVIEGVMMRNPNKVAIAVRKETGEIVSKTEDLLKFQNKVFKLPFIRGITNLILMLVVGMKGLIWSANQMTGEDEEEISYKEIVVLIITSFAFGIGFFVALPYVLTDLFGVREASQPMLFNLIDGILKIVMFVIYILAISFMDDVKRLFQYHGAEHMTVHCKEAGEELTVENCKKFSPIHNRCGSSFLMIVFVISIMVFSIIPVVVIKFWPGFVNLGLWPQKGVMFPIRLLFIPVIAAIGYEVLKSTAVLADKSRIVRFLVMPGLLLQRLTTKHPDEQQLEVAIHSLKLVEDVE